MLKEFEKLQNQGFTSSCETLVLWNLCQYCIRIISYKTAIKVGLSCTRPYMKRILQDLNTQIQVDLQSWSAHPILEVVS